MTGMQMEFIRKMPLPQELLRDYPIGTDLKRRKAERDAGIADILTGRDDRLMIVPRVFTNKPRTRGVAAG